MMKVQMIIMQIFTEIDTANTEYRRKILGNDERVLKLVRKEIGKNADEKFLTDEIILHPLHSGVAKEIAGNISDYKDLRSNSRAYKDLFLYSLAGSICLALKSRAKRAEYTAYSDVDWHEVSQSFIKKSAAIKNKFKEVTAWQFHG